ncbi:tetratricopeptide repeat (TPR)-like superfamily protein [Wolffia australiana]
MISLSASSFSEKNAAQFKFSRAAHHPPPSARFFSLSLPLHRRWIRAEPLSTARHPSELFEEAPSFKWVDLNEPETSREQAAAIAELPPKMTKRCRALMKQIICLSSENAGGLPLLLSAWAKAMKPRRADWLSVLKELETSDNPLFLQVFQLALLEDSFEANARDYTKIMGFLGRTGRFHDAETVFLAMQGRDLVPDQVAMTLMVNLYSKAGKFDLAKEAFEKIRLLTDDNPDKRAYGAMIMAYVRAGMAEEGEMLLREMDSREISACREVYKALLRAYAMAGDCDGAQRVFDAVQLAGVVPDARLCALLIHAYAAAGRPAAAVSALENMRAAGVQPNDKCVALTVAALRELGRLDRAMTLLADLEKDGGDVIGRETSAALASWFGQLGLSDELSGILGSS